MVLEFLGAFGECFDLKDEFPDGVSLGQNIVFLFFRFVFVKNVKNH